MILTVSNVALRRGAREVLRGVSFSARRGQIAALTGHSGSGKTTMLRIITGLESFDAGEIEVDGVTLKPGHPRKQTLRELRTRVGMVFQFHALFEHLTAIENVTLAPIHVSGQAPAAAERRASELLESFGVGQRRNAYPRELSGGEAQRVAIARAMAMNPPLLLMDEPTSSLDPARRFDVGETLRRLAKEGRTILIATHDEEFTKRYADSVFALEDGVLLPG
jgi:ABC-type polar amino acid transport system ATPase subunit